MKRRFGRKRQPKPVPAYPPPGVCPTCGTPIAPENETLVVAKTELPQSFCSETCVPSVFRNRPDEYAVIPARLDEGNRASY